MSDLLKVFISYAREDQSLVDVVVEALDDRFGHAISMTHMSRFEAGVDYKEEIDRKLDAADVLIVVASGKLKLSHSFTGYEVGWFKRSLDARPDIRNGSRRFILPLAILADPPDTISEVQGIKFPVEDRLFMQFDYQAGTISFVSEVIYKLLSRIDRAIDDLREGKRDLEKASKVQKDLKNASGLFAAKFLEALRNIAVDQQQPKIKFVVRVPGNWCGETERLADVITVTVQGPTSKLFSSPPKQASDSWLAFQKLLGKKDLARGWTDAIESMVVGTIDNQELSIEDQLVLSHDEKQVYRLFVSKSTLYFDKSREFDIYVIPILRLGDIGDKLTTYLAKAIHIGLRYRSLFLEANSPYLPINVALSRDLEQKKILTKRMLKELRILLVDSLDAHLDTPENIKIIFSGALNAVETVDEMRHTFDAVTEALLTSGDKFLEDGKADSMNVFIAKLGEFCAGLSMMNRSFLELALEQLKNVVISGSTRER